MALWLHLHLCFLRKLLYFLRSVLLLRLLKFRIFILQTVIWHSHCQTSYTFCKLWNPVQVHGKITLDWKSIEEIGHCFLCEFAALGASVSISIGEADVVFGFSKAFPSRSKLSTSVIVSLGIEIIVISFVLRFSDNRNKASACPASAFPTLVSAGVRLSTPSNK